MDLVMHKLCVLCLQVGGACSAFIVAIVHISGEKEIDHRFWAKESMKFSRVCQLVGR